MMQLAIEMRDFLIVISVWEGQMTPYYAAFT